MQKVETRRQCEPEQKNIKKINPKFEVLPEEGETTGAKKENDKARERTTLANQTDPGDISRDQSNRISF